MRYKIELDEDQLRVINAAVEEYFRVRMGQFYDLATDLASMGFNYGKHTREEFDTMIENRDNFLETSQALFHRMHKRGVVRPKESDIAIDIWRVIRHQFWKDQDDRSMMDIDATEPFPCVDDVPLMKIERVEDGE